MAGGHNSGSSGKNSKPDLAHGGGKQTSTPGDAGRQNSEMIGALSERVAAAAVCTVEGRAVNGLDLGPEWRSEVADWSRVRGVCVVRSTVAVVIVLWGCAGIFFRKIDANTAVGAT